MPLDKGNKLRAAKVRQSKRYSDNVDATIFAQSSEETAQNKKVLVGGRRRSVLDNCDALLDWLQEKRYLLEEGLEINPSPKK